MSQCCPACSADQHQELEKLPGLAPAFSANSANGVGKHSNPTEKVTLQMLRLCNPSLQTSACSAAGLEAAVLGSRDTEVSPGSQANPNPMRTLTTEATGYHRHRLAVRSREGVCLTGRGLYFDSYMIVFLYSNPEESSIDASYPGTQTGVVPQRGFCTVPGKPFVQLGKTWYLAVTFSI